VTAGTDGPSDEGGAVEIADDAGLDAVGAATEATTAGEPPAAFDGGFDVPPPQAARTITTPAPIAIGTDVRLVRLLLDFRFIEVLRSPAVDRVTWFLLGCLGSSRGVMRRLG